METFGVVLLALFDWSLFGSIWTIFADSIAQEVSRLVALQSVCSTSGQPSAGSLFAPSIDKLLCWGNVAPMDQSR
jgi:hypothetical protein